MSGRCQSGKLNQLKKVKTFRKCSPARRGLLCAVCDVLCYFYYRCRPTEKCFMCFQTLNFFVCCVNSSEFKMQSVWRKRVKSMKTGPQIGVFALSNFSLAPVRNTLILWVIKEAGRCQPLLAGLSSSCAEKCIICFRHTKLLCVPRKKKRLKFHLAASSILSTTTYSTERAISPSHDRAKATRREAAKIQNNRVEN